jgi:hypothetical protein
MSLAIGHGEPERERRGQPVTTRGPVPAASQTRTSTQGLGDFETKGVIHTPSVSQPEKFVKEVLADLRDLHTWKNFALGCLVATVWPDDDWWPVAVGYGVLVIITAWRDVRRQVKS